MNYLSTSIWIYTVKASFIVLACVGLLLLGVSGPLFYTLGISLLFAVGVSIYLHQLKECGVVYIPAKKSNWIIYIHGIPVRESLSMLSNPFFENEKKLKAFFSKLFVFKAIIQVSALYLTLHQSWDYFTYFSLGYIAIQAIIVVTVLILTWRLICTCQNILMIYRKEWLLFERENSQSGYVAAFFKRSVKKQTALVSGLDSLLAL